MRADQDRVGSPQSPVLTVRDLTTVAETRRGTARLLNRVSFDLHRGETLGLVGESGSGKSMTALSILRLNPTPATRITEGEVRYDGVDLLALKPKEVRMFRGKHIAMVLQDPQTALNPVFSIGQQIYESLRLHRGLRDRHMLAERAANLLSMLRIPDPERRLGAYPHQFSGGMRQRVVGAIALSSEPSVLIADEPTTSLDVTTQAAYLELLKEIQRETEIAILYITHDFSVIARMCDRVAVMYAGSIIESGPTPQILEAPAHPYTEALLRSVPDLATRPTRLPAIEGQPPDPFAMTPGCPFAPRCPYVMARCTTEMPPRSDHGPEHMSRCWRHSE